MKKVSLFLSLFLCSFMTSSTYAQGEDEMSYRGGRGDDRGSAYYQDDRGRMMDDGEGRDRMVGGYMQDERGRMDGEMQDNRQEMMGSTSYSHQYNYNQEERGGYLQGGYAQQGGCPQQGGYGSNQPMNMGYRGDDNNDNYNCAQPREVACGDCYCLYCRYEPCYYNKWKCDYCPQYSYKKCCRYVPQYYQKQCCRYVPQYYCVTCCRQVPEYYYVRTCRYVPKYTCERCCRYVPKYYYKHTSCPTNGCATGGCTAQQ